MSFKDISYLELWRPFSSVEWNHCAIWVEGIIKNFNVKLYEIGTSGSRDVVLKISYVELWRPSCSVERNHLCNFERGHHGEHSCEVIWNLDQWFRRCRLKKKFTDDGCITNKEWSQYLTLSLRLRWVKQGGSWVQVNSLWIRHSIVTCT